MPQSTLAGVITAIASVLTALGFVITAMSVLLPLLRLSHRNEVHLKANELQLKEVHTIVNQQRTDLQRYQVALVNVLNAHNIEVPPDQSMYVAPSTLATPAKPEPVPPAP